MINAKKIIFLTKFVKKDQEGEYSSVVLVSPSEAVPVAPMNQLSFVPGGESGRRLTVRVDVIPLE